VTSDSRIAAMADRFMSESPELAVSMTPANHRAHERDLTRSRTCFEDGLFKALAAL
jgi:hypothetical protein